MVLDLDLTAEVVQGVNSTELESGSPPMEREDDMSSNGPVVEQPCMWEAGKPQYILTEARHLCMIVANTAHIAVAIMLEELGVTEWTVVVLALCSVLLPWMSGIFRHCLKCKSVHESNVTSVGEVLEVQSNGVDQIEGGAGDCSRRGMRECGGRVTESQQNRVILKRMRSGVWRVILRQKRMRAENLGESMTHGSM